MTKTTDYINYENVSSLAGLFAERIKRTPNNIAYQQYCNAVNLWHSYTWQQMGSMIALMQAALENEQLTKGDRIAIMLPNCVEWVQFDQAALGLGLVVVPLYMNDHPDNVDYILENACAQILIVDTFGQWQAIKDAGAPECLKKVIVRSSIDVDSHDLIATPLEQFLAGQSAGELKNQAAKTDLASIVYTSGTTGKPKGVMLSHNNILWNAYSGLQSIKVYTSDHMLSFLPLSHTLERSIGYYLTVMSGSSTSFSR